MQSNATPRFHARVRRGLLTTTLALLPLASAHAQPQAAADELRDYGSVNEAKLSAAYDRGEALATPRSTPRAERGGDRVLVSASNSASAIRFARAVGDGPAPVVYTTAAAPVPPHEASPVAADAAPAQPALDAAALPQRDAGVLELLSALSPEELTALSAATSEKASKQEKQLEDEWDVLAAKAKETNALRTRAVQLESLVAALDRVHDTATQWSALRTPLPPVGAPWNRHTIDAELRKSEGIRLGDVNGDGKEDLLVAWEGQDLSRVYLQPDVAQITAPWPVVEVGRTPEVEDSVLVDLDRDGLLDAVSSLEKDEERVTVHWGPGSGQEDLGCGWARGKGFDRNAAWVEDEFLQVRGVTMWMYATPIQLRPGGPTGLVIGGKNYKADASSTVGLLIAPEQPTRDLAQWRWVPLADASWVMAIEVADLDADGDQDIVFSDKHGPEAGVHWLKNPGDASAPGTEWVRTALTAPQVDSANFLTLADLDQDGLTDIVAVVELARGDSKTNYGHRRVLFLRRTSTDASAWETHEILVPPGIGSAKGIAVGDIDQDGRPDIVLSSSGAEGDLIGTSWLRYEESPFDAVWTAHNIAGAPGTKYDLVHLADLDQDGDLDVLANDEKQDNIGLGVFWYENPTR